MINFSVLSSLHVGMRVNIHCYYLHAVFEYDFRAFQNFLWDFMYWKKMYSQILTNTEKTTSYPIKNQRTKKHSWQGSYLRDYLFLCYFLFLHFPITKEQCHCRYSSNAWILQLISTTFIFQHFKNSLLFSVGTLWAGGVP